MTASQAVSLNQRHTRSRPCQVCDGYSAQPQGKGVRCAGFRSTDGEYEHCQREQYAGNLPLDESTTPPTYAHWMRGDCRCGVTHGPTSHPSAHILPPRITRYELRDADGTLAGIHVRKDYLDAEGQPYRDKAMWWEQHNDRGATEMPLYGLLADRCAPTDALRIICEGEKATDALNAALALWTALYEPGSLVLMISQVQRQSSELFMKALTMCRTLGRPVDAEAETALTLRLTNGSRIVALPGKDGTIRSYSGVRLLLIDEAARVSTETYMAVRPMLAVSQGRLVTLSTPFGTCGWWYEAWRGAEPWERYEVPASACPRISAEFLAAEARAMGNWWFDQEYRCIFRDALTAVFRQEDIDRVFSEDYETWELGS